MRGKKFNRLKFFLLMTVIMVSTVPIAIVYYEDNIYRMKGPIRIVIASLSVVAVGFVICISKVPERFKPGVFDYCGTS